MQIQELKPVHKRKKRKRIGRGGKKGSYSGRGVKGQKSRAGRRFQPVIRELIKKYPKLRGYRFKRSKLKPVVLSIEILEKKFKSGEIVNPKILLEKGLIRKLKGKMPEIKILSKGKLTKPLTVEGCLLSKKAKEIIEKSHGMVK